MLKNGQNAIFSDTICIFSARKFNQNLLFLFFTFIGADTPLPDLNMVVSDADVSRNAEYELIIEVMLDKS